MGVKQPNAALRAVRFVHENTPHIGRLEGDTVVDAGLSSADGFVPTPEAWAALRAAKGERRPSAETKLLAPIEPREIICIGLNYRGHAEESGFPIPEAPIVFAKLRSSLGNPGEPVLLPAASTMIDWEAELAVVIGRELPAGSADVRRGVTAYTACNDLSDRDAQVRDGQWVRGKSFDGACPLGPALVQLDFAEDTRAIAVQGRVNGQVVQDDNTANLIFDVEEILRFITQTISLSPGDVICTGTPSGIGHSSIPPRYLRNGDVLETEVGDAGVLVTPIRAVHPL